MASRPLRVSDPLERSCLRLSIRTLEERAAKSEQVVISAGLARVIAKLLRSLLDG